MLSLAETNEEGPKTATDEKGLYAFVNLKPGTYSVSVLATFDTLEATPCKEGPHGFLRPMAHAGWFVVTTKTKTEAVQQLVRSDRFAVPVGQTVTKDIDMSCQAKGVGQGR